VSDKIQKKRMFVIGVRNLRMYVFSKNVLEKKKRKEKENRKKVAYL